MVLIKLNLKERKIIVMCQILNKNATKEKDTTLRKIESQIIMKNSVTKKLSRVKQKHKRRI